MKLVALTDNDGVIFDTEPIQLDATNYAFQNIGGSEISKEFYINNLVGNDTKLIGEILCSDKLDLSLGYKEEELEEKINLFLKIRTHYINQQFESEKIEPMNYAEEYFSFLKDNDIFNVIATGGSVKETILKYENAHLGHLIKGVPIVGCDSVSKGKPHPDTYLKAAKLANVDPKYCFAVEDTEPGTISARDAGVGLVIAVRNEFNQHKQFEAAHAIAHNLRDVVKIISYGK